MDANGAYPKSMNLSSLSHIMQFKPYFLF